MRPWGELILTSRKDIDTLFKEGVAYRGRHVLLLIRYVDYGKRRTMFVASRRVGNAVKRNRAKRVMRESYRGLVNQLPSDPVHIAWIARASCAKVKMQDVHQDMLKIINTCLSG
jgi:ribonuclease P protein component